MGFGDSGLKDGEAILDSIPGFVLDLISEFSNENPDEGILSDIFGVSAIFVGLGAPDNSTGSKKGKGTGKDLDDEVKVIGDENCLKTNPGAAGGNNFGVTSSPSHISGDLVIGDVSAEKGGSFGWIGVAMPMVSGNGRVNPLNPVMI
uniref:Uncharacterized protein n=1 Tax=Heliothis virescens TaxID=7102 RepID=A0A2A4JZ02_HELVI